MGVGTRHVSDVKPGVVNLNVQTVASLLNVGLGLAFMDEPQLQITAKAGEFYVVESDSDLLTKGPVLKVRDSAVLSEVQNSKEARPPAR